jgi:prepilin-type N-terminal cleavage/methylation domain-containing protein
MKKGGASTGNQKGFTIVELIIASSVFSVILLVATAGIIYIGRSYYKGIITSRTQETTRSITQEISNSFQFGGDAQVTVAADSNPIDMGSGVKAYAQCVGNFRYSYVIGSKVAGSNNTSNPSTPTTRHGLWLDVINKDADCNALDLREAVPEDDSTSTEQALLNQRRELLPQNMRLDQFSLDQPAGRSFLNINVKLIYGDHDLSPSGICVPNSQGGQFCATSGLNTTVKKRL